MPPVAPSPLPYFIVLVHIPCIGSKMNVKKGFIFHVTAGLFLDRAGGALYIQIGLHRLEVNNKGAKSLFRH
jgi:hypothetical protein